MNFKPWFVLWCALLVGRSHAQTSDGDWTGANKTSELGFDIGNLLPNEIKGVTEIMGVGGVHGGLRLAPLTYGEVGVLSGNGNGAKWKNLHADLRMDIPVENLVGLAYVGLDNYYYSGADGGGSHIIFGGHVGGGLQVGLTDTIWFRSDMKFNFSPGTSLYIGAGFVFRFGG